MATVNANSSMINIKCYENCASLVNVDLANVPFVNHNAYLIFNNCLNLKSVTNINSLIFDNNLSNKFRNISYAGGVNCLRKNISIFEL